MTDALALAAKRRTPGGSGMVFRELEVKGNSGNVDDMEL